MNVYEGTVLTVNANDEVFRFLVEDKGRILFVGDELPREYAGQPRISLGQRVLAPSFVDTHEHFASFGMFTEGPNRVAARASTAIAEMG